MPRNLNRLTANQIKAATGNMMLLDGGGLYLQVRPSGSRSWLFRYRWEGKRPEIGLGSYPEVPLSEARRRAELARLALAEMPPRDPRQAIAGTQKEDVPNFQSFTEEWLDANLHDFRNAKHRQQWRSTLSTYAEPLSNKRIDMIETADVLEAIAPIWNEKRETARRVRGRIERILDAARAKGLRSGDNPARWRGHLNALLPDQQKPVRHHPAMPFGDVPGFLSDLRERDALSARTLEFIILTATRSSEGRGARWSEIDFDNRLWTIPSERMKAGRTHRVPLSDAAVNILEGLKEIAGSGVVFPNMRGNGCVTETALRNLMKRMQTSNATIHGFRSSFRDWAGEYTSFPRDVAEMALAHVVESPVERAYRRGDALEKRRQLMQAWSDFLSSCVRDNVMILHGDS